MKVLALSGSNADQSYNMALLKYIAKHFANKYEVEITSVKGLPMFKEGEDPSNEVVILADKIKSADMIIIATPEQQNSVPSCLKSALEWLSSAVHPFHHKPVVVVSTSSAPQGGSRAQLRLKSILISPGFGARVFNGDEFMMWSGPEQMDKDGNITSQGTIEFMDHFFDEVDEWYTQLQK